MIITRTPFRMSFFGGGTDMPEFFNEHGGSVISTTFDKYCYVTARHLPRFFDYSTELVYSKIERVSDPSELEHPAVRNAMQMLDMREMRITYEADLPARSGLGTSSSFAVGMLNAFHCMKGTYASKDRLAREAIKLERELCAEAGGWQDQIAAAFGGLNRIDFADGDFSVRPIVISPEYNIGDSDYMERLFSFFPNQPEPLVAQIINCYMDFGSPQEESKRSVANALRMLLSFHCPLREMSLLLLGGGLLFVDKTVRSYAAELWVEGIANNRIDNHRLGEIVARIINMGIVPLKRFTTEVYESIYKRSAFHNQQLEELLTVLIGGLPDNPVTGQKQLLELYAEVLRVNGHCVTDDKVRERLEMWKKNANLKKVVTALER